MTKASLLFYNTNAQIKDTLHRNITPTEDQREEQITRWNDLAEYLKESLKERTSLNITTWLQGSYKFITQIRPVSKGEEFDIDLGLYFEVDKKPTEEEYSPKNFKKMVQTLLKAYGAANNDEVIKVADPAKERCSRISFTGDFHIDVPCYYEIKGTDKRELATETNGWENSDPVAFFEWFHSSFSDSERAVARRIIQYIKCWAALTFRNDKASGRPSSVLITVLVTKALLSLQKNTFDLYDDEVLTVAINKIFNGLQVSQTVKNPVNTNEVLSDRVTNFEIFLEELEKFVDVANKAIKLEDALDAALKWEEIFAHFIPKPEEKEESQKQHLNSLITFRVEPIVRISAQASNKIESYSGVNKIGPIPKGCEIKFKLENLDKYPVGCTVQWTVRNRGSDSEYVNDLGHTASSGQFRTEHSEYTGNHFMDCIIKYNNQVVGFKSIPVHINGVLIPRRNPLKPSWVGLRNKR